MSGRYIFKGDVKLLGNIDFSSVSSKVPDSSTQVWVHPAGSQYRRSILCLRLATQIKGYGLVKLQCLIFSHSGPFASSTGPTPSLPPPSLLPPSLSPLIPPPSLSSSLPSHPSLVVVFLNQRGQLGRVFFNIHEADGQCVPLWPDQISSIIQVLQISLLQLESLIQHRKILNC